MKTFPEGLQAIARQPREGGPIGGDGKLYKDQLYRLWIENAYE